jgi:hypothetical protein
MNWGNEFDVESALRRPIVHAGCGGQLTPLGNCGKCGVVPGPRELDVHPRRVKDAEGDDRISRLLRKPHRMLEPLVDAG